MGCAVSMTNSHTEKLLQIGANQWKPISPPKSGDDRTAFYAFMLLPGFSISFFAATLRRSRSSITAYRAAAIKAAQLNPAILEAVHAAVCTITAEHGLQMARLRGKSQLPAWSRLAVREYSKQGFSRREIAVAFKCSPGTVANVLQGKGTAYVVFTGERCLTTSQKKPAGRWRARNDPKSCD